MRTTAAILSFALCLSTSARPDEVSSDELAVWELEEAYYPHVKANDPESYLRLFDENVISWPAMDGAPKGKDRVSQWIAAVHANPSETWIRHGDTWQIISGMGGTQAGIQ